MSEAEAIADAGVEVPRRKVGRPRKPVNPEMTSYLLEDIPRELWLKFRAKTTGEDRSMKEVLNALIKAYVEAEA